MPLWAPVVVPGWIYGLTLSNDGGDLTNDIRIASGRCANDSTFEPMILPSSLTKRIDAAWAQGNNQGGMDTGARAANETYQVWLIQNATTKAVDALFSLGVNTPTAMPAGWVAKRRLGAILTGAGGGAIIRFFQQENYFWLRQMTSAFAGPAPNTDQNTVDLNASVQCIPQYMDVVGILQLMTESDNPGDYTSVVLLPTFQPDDVPDPLTFTSATVYVDPAVVSAISGGNEMQLRISGGEVNYRSSYTGAYVYIQVKGWIDMRDAYAKVPP